MFPGPHSSGCHLLNHFSQPHPKVGLCQRIPTPFRPCLNYLQARRSLPSTWTTLQLAGTGLWTPRSCPELLRRPSACRAERLGRLFFFFLLANRGAFSQRNYLPDFQQVQEPPFGHRTFGQDRSNLGGISSSVQMQYGPVPQPATMQDMPALFRRESAVRNGACNATATPGFFAAECGWNNTNLPAANLYYAAHDMDALAWETKHVNFGEQPLPNSLSEGLGVSHEGLRSDAIVSGSPRACSCPVCLGLHTNLFSSKVPSSALVPRDRYSCRLPACDRMARGLDGADSESLHQCAAPARGVPLRPKGTIHLPRRALPVRYQTLGRSDTGIIARSIARMISAGSCVLWFGASTAAVGSHGRTS